jgi:DNA-binding NarL/FixJ family response regulator
LEVIKKLKTVAPETYVIMLSADDNINVAVVALRHGAHEYIVKSETASTRLEMALNAIRNALNQTRDLKDSKKVNVVMLVVYVLVILAVYALSLLYPSLFKMG